MEQLSRAMQLHHLLLTSRQPPSRDYLLERLECSVSTFKRLLQTLREQHQIPIIFDRALGGYRYETEPDSLTLPSAFFTESELFALLMAEQLLEQAQPGLLGASIARLRTQTRELLGRDRSGRSLLRLHLVARQSVKTEIFDTVLNALLCANRLQFGYRRVEGSSAENSRRIVSPQTLLWYRDNWYLIAFCHAREALRIFALSRMDRPQLLTELAVVCDEAEVAALLGSGYGIFPGSTPLRAEVLFDPSAAPWVEPVQWHPEQQLERLADGRIYLALPFNDLRELTRDLLRFAAEMEVISPPELRQAVVSAMQAGLARHGS